MGEIMKDVLFPIITYVLSILLIIYIFLRIIVGRKANSVFRFLLVAFVLVPSKIVVMTFANTLALSTRLATCLGDPSKAGEAWSKYIEAMAKAIVGRNYH